MTVRRRRSDRSGRSKLHSPGRPDSARREELVRFWAAIATGRSSEDAARDAGVSPPVGSRWFRRSGGMPPSHLSQSAKPLSGRYLSFEEREEIALLRAQGRGIRHIACRLERAPSTISREVRRNAATRSGGPDYRATTAQWHADRSAKRPKPAKLATNEALRCGRCAMRCTVGLGLGDEGVGLRICPTDLVIHPQGQPPSRAGRGRAISPASPMEIGCRAAKRSPRLQTCQPAHSAFQCSTAVKIQPQPSSTVNTRTPSVPHMRFGA